MGERGALTEEMARRYRSASKQKKAVVLGEFVDTTGYTRKYAIHLLNSWGRTRVVRIDGQMVRWSSSSSDAAGAPLVRRDPAQ